MISICQLAGRFHKLFFSNAPQGETEEAEFKLSFIIAKYSFKKFSVHPCTRRVLVNSVALCEIFFLVFFTQPLKFRYNKKIFEGTFSLNDS